MGEALPGGFGEQGKTVFISGEQGNKDNIGEQGT